MDVGGTERFGNTPAAGRLWRVFSSESTHWTSPEETLWGVPEEPAPTGASGAIYCRPRVRCGVPGCSSGEGGQPSEREAGVHEVEVAPRKNEIKPASTSLAAAVDEILSAGWRRSGAFGWVCPASECRSRIPEGDGAYAAFSDNERDEESPEAL